MSARMNITGGIEVSLREDTEDLLVVTNTTTIIMMLSWFREEREFQGLVQEIITLKVIDKIEECSQGKDKMSLIVVE
jgi:hypothetical protein